MKSIDILKNEFDGEEGSFLLIARCELRWDWEAFYRLTKAMYDVAECFQNESLSERWIAQGFWFCDTWIKDWTSHRSFPSPEKEKYDDAIERIHDLAYFFFVGDNPFI